MVVVLAISWTMTSWLTNGLPRQFWTKLASGGDERKQPVLLLVPFAGARRQVANGDRDAEVVGNSRFHRRTHTITAAAIGVDQQFACRRITGRTKLLPPAADSLESEGGSIVVDAEIDPPRIGRDVIHAVGYCLTEFGDHEIMRRDRLGLTLRAQLTSAILEVANKLFLLGIDRDRRFADRLERLHLGVDMVELRVAVRMVRPPSRVLLLACKLKPSFFSGRPISVIV